MLIASQSTTPGFDAFGMTYHDGAGASLYRVGIVPITNLRLGMRAFIDFEASSLGRHGYPIEVAWVFEDGTAEAFLIRPIDKWTDWDPAAQAIHGISREELLQHGATTEDVANRLVTALQGHEVFASAPSWDGKWLSALLRSAGLPRHAVRLTDIDLGLSELAEALLAPHVPS